MVQILIRTLIIFIPLLGVVSGFSTATTIPVLLLIFITSLRTRLFEALNYRHVKKILLSNWKLELAFALWCLIANFYSSNYPESLIIYGQILFIAIIGFTVSCYVPTLSTLIPKIETSFIIGTGIAITLFYIEYFSHGIITTGFRAIFQPSSEKRFFLFALDRGCSILSIFSWSIIFILTQRHKYFLSLCYYAFILLTLSISDSLASFIAFIAGGIVFLISRLAINSKLQTFFLKLFILGIIGQSILMPIISYKIKPYKALNNYANFLPSSAKHRVYIWHYVAKKIREKPILGHGFTSSKHHQVETNQIMEYNGWKWHPLPLHPHNNIMQILFETGLIGYVLYLALLYKYINNIGNLPLNKNRKYDINRAVSDRLNYTSASYATFINYYIISMISFSIWQTWWVCTAFGTLILLKLLAYQMKFS